MTQNEIIRMAREASNTPIDHHATPDLFGVRQIERFAALVAAHERNRHAWTQEHWTQYEHAIAAAEREACAKAAEEYLTQGRSPLGKSVAAAIRSRCSPPSEKN